MLGMGSLNQGVPARQRQMHVLAEQMVAHFGSQKPENGAKPQPLAGSAHL